MIKPFKIKVTPEQSAIAQKILYERRIFWCSCLSNDKARHTNFKYLVVKYCLQGSLGIAYIISPDDFDERELPCLSFDDFLTQLEVNIFDL